VWRIHFVELGHVRHHFVELGHVAPLSIPVVYRAITYFDINFDL
jgi:hypothetical protein